MSGQQELQPLEGSGLSVELGGLSSDYLQRTYSREPTTPSPPDSSDCWVRHGAMGSRTLVILLWWAPHANMTRAGLLQIHLRTSPRYTDFVSSSPLYRMSHVHSQASKQGLCLTCVAGILFSSKVSQ